MILTVSVFELNPWNDFDHSNGRISIVHWLVLTFDLEAHTFSFGHVFMCIMHQMPKIKYLDQNYSVTFLWEISVPRNRYAIINHPMYTKCASNTSIQIIS